MPRLAQPSPHRPRALTRPGCRRAGARLAAAGVMSPTTETTRPRRSRQPRPGKSLSRRKQPEYIKLVSQKPRALHDELI